MGGKKELSLLPDSENYNSLQGRLFRWLTTVGRVVIIVTELIVVSAFLSRFYLDRKNADLSESLRQQKAILESTKEFEQEFDLLQNRLSFIKSFSGQSSHLPPHLISLAQSIPTGVVVTDLRVDDADAPVSKVSLSANADQQDNIVDFVTNISLNPQISAIEIKRIEKKPRNDKYLIDLSLQIADAKGGP
ncbi:PilN domain-containing protein [Patescibacteria group bacterium]|nr:PilN domain-containing protein [Patescibacteria group bacterium]